METQADKNQNTTEVELIAEELEPVIAPGISPNHNEMFTAGGAELEAEELERSGLGINPNETFAVSSTELEIEELEPVIAPIAGTNHNETFLTTL